jgi:hypothetical protein
VFRHQWNASRWSSRAPEGRSFVAAAVTLIIHVLVFSFLKQAPVPHAVVRGQEHALEVVWIERLDPLPSPPGPAPATGVRVASEPTATPAAKRRAASPSGPAFPVAAPVATAQVPVVADDVWEALPGRASSGASTIDPSAFRRDPLARRDTAFDSPPAPLEGAIQDRSFGGWVQRATRGNICGDLARALRTTSGSTDAIMASIRRYKCKV